MSNIREKIALIVFALAMVGATLGVVLYLVIGHSWNIAATHIDDTIEQYERFDVVVYEGLVEDTLIGNRAIEPGEEDPSRRYTMLEAELLAERYRAQDASVLVLDVLDPRRYDEGMVLYRDGSCFGVLTVYAMDTKEYIRDQVDWLNSMDLDMVILLVPYQSILEGIHGVDVAIVMGDGAGTYAGGVTERGICYVSPPGYGYTGAALMSDNGVVLIKRFPYGDYSKRFYELGI